jgi:protein TonB
MPYSSYQYQASLRSRLIAFALAAGIVALLLVMLIRLGVIALPAKVQQAVTTLQLLPGTQSEASRTPTPTKGKRAAKGASGAKPTRVTKVTPQPKAPQPKVPPVPWNVMPLSSQDMAKADIANMPSHNAATIASNGQGQNGTGSGAGGQSADGSGEGPGGAQLYNAEWYRKPTDAEMSTYMPRNGVQPGAWGMIACKTIPDYRVEDCRELGESPGSGMSRAMREAAWQFRILPPRLGGKPLMGVWVRIRYDIVARGTEESDSGG